MFIHVHGCATDPVSNVHHRLVVMFRRRDFCTYVHAHSLSTSVSIAQMDQQIADDLLVQFADELQVRDNVLASHHVPTYPPMHVSAS